MKALTLYILSFFICFSIFAQDDILYLTKELEFITKGNKTKKLSPGGYGITLFKVVDRSEGIVEVELIQENGRPRKENLFISDYWLKKGTAEKLITDPNIILSNTQTFLSGRPYCLEKDFVFQPPFYSASSDRSSACNILKTRDFNDKKRGSHQLLACFEELRNKIPSSGSVYERLGALYTLKPEEQNFMARILTAYGEARGANPTKEQLKGVMQVIDNRERYAKKKYPKANGLDVVLQNWHFSMYNPKDGNWKKALAADNKEVMAIAMEAYIETQTQKSDLSPNIYHYMTTSLSRSSSRPSWATSSKKTKVVVDGKNLERNPGHVFYKNVAWSFNPNNRYKK